MVMFVSWGRMPAWVLVIVIARELGVSALRLIAVDNGKVIAAGWSGKVKTAATMVCICVMLALNLETLDLICNGVILVTTAYSGVEYFIQNRNVLNWKK